MLLVKLVVTTFTNVEKVYLNAKEKQAIRTEKWRKMMGEREREEKKIKERKEIREKLREGGREERQEAWQYFCNVYLSSEYF